MGIGLGPAAADKDAAGLVEKHDTDAGTVGKIPELLSSAASHSNTTFAFPDEIADATERPWPAIPSFSHLRD
jgi:hypothetical protein